MKTKVVRNDKYYTQWEAIGDPTLGLPCPSFSFYVCNKNLKILSFIIDLMNISMGSLQILTLNRILKNVVTTEVTHSQSVQ